MSEDEKKAYYVDGECYTSEQSGRLYFKPGSKNENELAVMLDIPGFDRFRMFLMKIEAQDLVELAQMIKEKHDL